MRSNPVTGDAALDANPTSGPRASARRGFGFARRAYGLRCIGLAMGCVLVETVLWSQQESLGVRLFVLAYCLVWPHLGYAVARLSSHPGDAERCNMYVDDLLGGTIIAAMKFAWLPGTLVLLMFMMNHVAAGGWRQLAKGTAVCAIGMMVGAIVFGFNFDCDGASATMLACIPMLIVYPLSLGIVSHRTALKLAERSRELKQLSERDSLTGLLNRATLARSLSALISEARHTNGRVSVLFMDLDDFKAVNDSLGHRVGDELLATVAARLTQACHETEIVARYGGDEFVVVSTRSPFDAAVTMAATLIDSVRAPVSFSGADLRVGLSVGISTFPEHGDEAEALLKKADVAMYAAKKGGPNRSVIFEDGLGPAAIRRLKVENPAGAPLCPGSCRAR